MSALLGRTVGHHDVDVDHDSTELMPDAHARFELPVQWPHMWRPGHKVTIRTTDDCTFTGAVLGVSEATKKVLIELL